MGDRDKWRHVRAVLAARTPGSELLVHRAGGEIVAVVGEKMARVLVLRVPEGVDQARADADLDALSTLWNVADELLAAAEALAGALKEVERLRAALREIRGEAYYGLERQSLDGVLLSVEGTARRALGLPMAPWGLADDTPGQGAERSGHGH